MPKQVDGKNGGYTVGKNTDIDDSASIGENTTIWDDAHIFPNVAIGRGSVIGAGVYIETDVKLGDFCKVQRGVTLYKGVEAEDYVFFGPNATTTNDRNPRSFGEWELARTHIGIGASIGANATVIAGHSIGALSLVAAGAVVTRDVPACQLVGGNPARFMGWVDVSGKVVSRDINDIPDQVKQAMNDPRGAVGEYINSKGRL